MRKLNMLLAAAFLGGSAVLMPVAAAPQGLEVQVGAAIEAQYGDADVRGRMSVSPREAEAGERVTVSGRGLPPGLRLQLVAGRTPSRLMVIQSVRVDAYGRISVRAPVPEWALPGRNLFFALQTRGGRLVALARPVRVIESDEYDGEDEQITVTGDLLNPYATCPRLAGDDGRVYALAGSLRQFEAGDRVRVTGELAEVSICNQRRTIVVERIRSAD